MADYNGILITSAVLTAIGLLILVAVLIFNIRFMKFRFIKMTSPKLNIFLILGATLLYISGLLSVVSHLSTAAGMLTKILQGRNWTLSFGFTLVFGSMLLKGWRVYKLFQYPRVHTVTIKDGVLIIGLLILLSVDLVVLLCWQLIDPMTCVNLHNDKILDALSQDSNSDISCSSTYKSLWIMLLVCYKQILLITCSYIGWQIRHVTFAALDDSRCLLLSSGIGLSLIGLLLIITVLFPTDTSAHTFLLCIFIWIGSTAIVNTAFLPKVIIVLKSDGMEPLACSGSKYMEQVQSDDVGIELVKLLGENHYLKQRLEQREAMLTHLQRQVSSSLNTDCESQQTTSVKYSVSTTTTNATLSSKTLSVLSQIKLCMLGCCDSKSDSIKAKQGTPAPIRDLTVNISDDLTDSGAVGQNISSYWSDCKNCRAVNPSLIGSDINTVNAGNGVGINYIGQKEDDGAEINYIGQKVPQSQRDQVISVDMESLPTQLQEIKASTLHKSLRGTNNSILAEDLDLICSIADTYDLGSDSDTFSFITNCLYNANNNAGNSMSLQRRKPIYPAEVTVDHSATLGCDQLYPVSMASSLRPPRPPRSNKKHRRRVSSPVSASSSKNMYVTNKGQPMIL